MMDLNSKFTEIFTDLFEGLDISKNKFAQQAGIKHSQVTAYLKGIIPNTCTIVKICDYFNCSIDYITGIDEQFSYKGLRKGMDSKCFYPEYQRLLDLNSTNHYRLSKKGIVNNSQLIVWKRNEGIPQFEVIMAIAYELGGSIDKMLGRI